MDAPADPVERAALRTKALTWLRADFVLRQKQAGSLIDAERKTAAATLAHWLVDSDLSGTRPGPHRTAVPAAEQAAWNKFWADVKAKLAEAQKPPPSGKEHLEQLAQVSVGHPKDTTFALKVAALQAWFGKDKEFAATRKRLLAFAKDTSDVITAERIARACSLLPSTDQAELEAALASAEPR